ncbi:MAG: lactonase family protein [Terracidiphilus sp.]
MKFSKLSQLFLVSSIGLLVATLFSACAITTIDYIFVASSAGSGTSSAGQIETYAVDAQSGALRTGAPTVSSGGVNPVAMAVTHDYANLYVANAGNSSIVHFAIGLHGELTTKDTITITGTPVAIAVNQANTYLYVVSGPSPAELTAYPLSSGAIGTAASTKTLSLANVSSSYANDTLVPTGLSVLANNAAVYVTAYDQSAYNPGTTITCPSIGCANPGWVFGYSVGSGGVLSPLANPFEAGIKPTAIATDPTNRFAYVTDYASNQLIGYTIMSSSTLNFMPGGPYRTGDEPTAVIIDPRGMFVYVTNSLDSTVSPYSLNLATGAPTISVSVTAGAGSNSTDTQPVAVTIDPAVGRFVYTANYLGNSVSGFILDPTSGALSQTQATPYPTGFHPTAVIGVPHGNYSTQSVAP